MFDNTDNMARIEREIEKRMEAVCEKNGWYVAVAMMPPERTTLHISCRIAAFSRALRSIAR